MTAYVFLGPTLPVDEARGILDAVYLPPARQGDVHRVAVREDARMIGIVDGYFDQVPAVWHKEVLWALASGVAVYGSASMGALRAAELAPFGVIGVGHIFQAYLAGQFEDDDEVAVVHGPPELGYRPLCEAMVNIRATVARAVAAGIVGEESGRSLVDAAKALFYRERSYDALLQRGADLGVPRGECEALRAWLPHNAVDQKRDDALSMLTAMRDALAARQDVPSADPVPFTFENTAMWVRASRVMLTGDDPNAGALAELRLQGAPYLKSRRAALARVLAEPADDRGAEAVAGGSVDGDRATVSVQEQAGRRIEADARRCGLEALAEDVSERLIVRHVIADLRATGALAGLAQRAEAKARALAALTGPGGRYAEVPDPEALMHWYFHRLQRPIPDDLHGYAQRHGFGDAAAFHRAVAEEYVFVRHEGAEG